MADPSLRQAARYALVLHPEDPFATPPQDAAILRALTGVGLAGRALSCAGQVLHLPGERFLELIVFLGCSPYVQIVPPEGRDPCQALDAFCHLRMQRAERLGPALRRARNAAPPRCPACRSPAPGWATTPAAAEAVTALEPWRCASCGWTGSLHALDWRQCAGFAQVFVEVWGVHPGEAVPSDELLSALGAISAGPWRWFYDLI
jgi:hypothetical protein